MKRIWDPKILIRLHDLLVFIFFVSFIFNIRWFVGLATILMTVNAFLFHRLESGRWWNPRFFNPFIIGLYLYFVVQAIALLYTRNLPYGLEIAQTNLGMIVLPVGVFYSSLVNQESFGRWMKGYIYILLAATVIALGHALILFLNNHNTSVFFYHALVGLYSKHAIQFSVIVFIGILFLFDEYSKPRFFRNRTWIIWGIIYLSAFLFLLSSKLVFVIYFLYIFYLIALTGEIVRKKSYRMTGLIIMIALITAISVSDTPFKKRMKEEWDARISMIQQQKFSPADYFTGVQFRVVSWRFVYEILNEKHAWILGVSPGDAQDALNEKYARENMYIGEVAEHKTGYLGYHSHNQFLQAVLETGIFGLISFIVACVGLILLAIKSRERSLYIFTLLLLCNCFTDAPLKTQYGIILFVFFPLLLYGKTPQRNQTS
jgi:O-antigen ligase